MGEAGLVAGMVCPGLEVLGLRACGMYRVVSQGQLAEQDWSTHVRAPGWRQWSRDAAVMSETDERTQPGGIRALALDGGQGDASYSFALTFYKVMRMSTPPHPAASP